MESFTEVSVSASAEISRKDYGNPVQQSEASRKEYRVFGPPGTGKTTYLAEQIQRAAAVHGGAAVIVTSFTKAAAREIAVRRVVVDGEEKSLPVPKENVGTLHSLCFHALGNPKICEKGDLRRQWNAQFGSKRPEWAVEDEAFDVDDPYGMEQIQRQRRSEGLKAVHAEYMLLRAKMKPRDAWPLRVGSFAKQWEGFKKETGSVDFTDLIELGLTQLDGAPGRPVVGFVDETQDMSTLELALVRKWSERMHRIVMAGDDDQAIYSWKGATPEAFLWPPVPDDQKRFLRHSYRLPSQVKDFADRWIRKVKNREPKEFSPRCDGGVVRTLACHGFEDGWIVLRDARRYLEAGKTVMFLAACAYMLPSIMRALKEQAVPFWNPSRKKNGAWNPLRHPAPRILAFTSASRKLHGEEAMPWTWSDAAEWIEVLDSKRAGLARGAKEAAKRLAADKETSGVRLTHDDVAALFEDPTPGSARPWEDGDLKWLWQNMLTSKKSEYERTGNFEYACRVFSKRGVAGLAADPRCVVGTIHSVKGAEADVVYVFTELSGAGAGEWYGPGKDSIYRQFYVAFTRAREEIVIVHPGLRGESVFGEIRP